MSNKMAKLAEYNPYNNSETIEMVILRLGLLELCASNLEKKKKPKKIRHEILRILKNLNTHSIGPK